MREMQGRLINNNPIKCEFTFSNDRPPEEQKRPYRNPDRDPVPGDRDRDRGREHDRGRDNDRGRDHDRGRDRDRDRGGGWRSPRPRSRSRSRRGQKPCSRSPRKSSPKPSSPRKSSPRPTGRASPRPTHPPASRLKSVARGRHDDPGRKQSPGKGDRDKSPGRNGWGGRDKSPGRKDSPGKGGRDRSPDRRDGPDRRDDRERDRGKQRKPQMTQQQRDQLKAWAQKNNLGAAA